MYDSPQQFLRLLRLLYRPQNVYCIHYDVKSLHKEFFESIARCFDNVMIATKLENVVWGYYTIMQAQMNCMADLLEYREKQTHNKWQYSINLCGKELPLTTNREMVVKLKRLNGTSSIITESAANHPSTVYRIEHPVTLTANKTQIIQHDDKLLENRPFDLALLHKSSFYNALSFQFAEYLIFDKKANTIYDFFKQTSIAEEQFYATLYKNPGVPGGFNKHVPRSNYFEVAGSFWTKVNTFQKGKKYDCRGLVIHQICVVGAGDLQEVVRESGSHLFHNKYFMEFDHSVMDCMEERIVERNRLEYRQDCGAANRPLLLSVTRDD